MKIARAGFCMGDGPNAWVFLTPSQGLTGCGGFQRRSPTGGSANGIPLKTRIPSGPVVPSMMPPVDPDPVVGEGHRGQRRGQKDDQHRIGSRRMGSFSPGASGTVSRRRAHVTTTGGRFHRVEKANPGLRAHRKRRDKLAWSCGCKSCTREA